MDASVLALIVIVAVALAFDYTNGFHDAANAIAVAVSTKALTPRIALGLAAVMNLVGAVISTKVAATVGGGIIDPPTGTGARPAARTKVKASGPPASDWAIPAWTASAASVPDKRPSGSTRLSMVKEKALPVREGP